MIFQGFIGLRGRGTGMQVVADPRHLQEPIREASTSRAMVSSINPNNVLDLDHHNRLLISYWQKILRCCKYNKTCKH